MSEQENLHMPNNSNSVDNDEISLKELILKVKEWYLFLLAKWKLITAVAFIGAMITPVIPPIAAVCQFKVQFASTTAVKGKAVSLRQKEISLTIGACGNGLTVTLIKDREPSQAVAVIV